VPHDHVLEVDALIEATKSDQMTVVEISMLP
jgi:hypothetical protein